MNTGINACASSYGTVQWPDINWAQCIRNVRRLQMRIVKATQGGRWNKVKVLQRLLTSSFSGKALAVKGLLKTKAKGQQELTGRYGQPLRANLMQYKTLTDEVISLFR